MNGDGEASIRRMEAGEAHRRIAELADLLVDAVAHGASVNFMDGFARAEATAWWQGVLPGLAAHERILLVAEAEGRIVGSVQLVPAPQPNQPHRGDVAKMLVHSAARRRGLGRRLLEAAEATGRGRGLTLLCLDTETGGDAERLYRRGGWTALGAIPGYALKTDGTPSAATFFYKQIGAG